MDPTLDIGQHFPHMEEFLRWVPICPVLLGVLVSVWQSRDCRLMYIAILDSIVMLLSFDKTMNSGSAPVHRVANRNSVREDMDDTQAFIRRTWMSRR